MRSRTIWPALLALAVLLLVPGTAGSAEQPQRFIVVFKDFATPQAAPAARELAGRFGARPDFVYENALKGFAVTLAPGLAAQLAADSRVAYVEQDAEVTTMTTQSGATWGLDRIDQRALPLNGSFSYNATGAGVTAYIIDTGIRFSHNEFGGRALSGFDAVDGGSADDCNGHGTHVAGTVGGSTYGVAKGVSIVAVRVLNCSGSGTTSGVIAGIDWVTSNHTNGAAVANMSLGGSASSALDSAVSRSIADGVTYAVAAGNGNRGGKAQDACNYSPARTPDALTIGATDSTDTKPRWSNYGACVDWFAPGVSITSAWYTGNSATNTISGTSMATPHVAGVAALYLQGSPGSSPAAVRAALWANLTTGVVKSSSTTNNHLLFSNY
jgi:subtilisin family serine protease